MATGRPENFTRWPSLPSSFCQLRERMVRLSENWLTPRFFAMGYSGPSKNDVCHLGGTMLIRTQFDVKQKNCRMFGIDSFSQGHYITAVFCQTFAKG